MLVLSLFCVHKAWAGVWLYQGERAFKEKRYERARSFFEEAKRINPWDNRLNYRLGQAEWQLAFRTKDKDGFERAGLYFQNMAQALPFYGRAWLYLGLSELARERLSDDGLQPSEWQGIKKYFFMALEKEPGSAWTAYHFGESFLSQDHFLSEEEKEMAFSQMRRAMALGPRRPSSPFLGKPSEFLKQGLSFVWEHFRDFDLLRTMVPSDPSSYRYFLDFLSERSLWKYRESVEPESLNLQKAFYERECQRGEEALSRKEFKRAFWAFRKAFWMRSWSYPKAKAGILIAEQAMGELPEGPHPLWKEDYRKTLRTILTEEDDPIGDFLLRKLGPVVQSAGDDELETLYRRRLQGLPAAQEKIPLPPKLKYDASAWWGDKANPTLTLNLPPGRATLRLFLRRSSVTEPKMNEGGYVILRLNGRPVKGIFVNQAEWREIRLTIETSGGKRWLKADLLNGVKDEAGQVVPLVKYGPVEVRFTQ